MKVIGKMTQEDTLQMLGAQYKENESIYLLDKMTAEDFRDFLSKSKEELETEEMGK